MNLTDIIRDKVRVLSDGAWGTEMARHGLSPGDCPELYNVDHPDIISDIADTYIAAGSDIILTNTFGGSPFKLAKYDLADRTEEINGAGAALSVEAASGKAYVFASIGPTGEFMSPLGTVTEKEMVKAFARQVRPFAEAGVDGVVVETMTDLGEITCALKAVKDNSDLPVICSMTYDKGPKGYATMMGVQPQKAVGELQNAGADAVGSNCGSGIRNMIELAAIMHPETDLPLWFKPNAGMPELVDGETVYRDTPESMAARVSEIFDAGATFFGGCCGTTPDHIRAFREVIDGLAVQ